MDTEINNKTEEVVLHNGQRLIRKSVNCAHILGFSLGVIRAVQI
jgi:hypothetical protein